MSTNLFYNLYNQRSDEEIVSIIKDDHYSEDARLCAIQISKERNLPDQDFIHIEQELIANRDSRSWNIAPKRYSTGFDRYIALVIDGIALSIASGIIKIFSTSESTAMLWLLTFIDLLIPYLYSILLHGYCGQTFGKMIMNVKIFDVSEKKSITYKQALMRDIVPLVLIMITQVLTFLIPTDEFSSLTVVTYILAFTLIMWALLEVITMLFNEKRRALHDFIAGTVVLKVRN